MHARASSSEENACCVGDEMKIGGAIDTAGSVGTKVCGESGAYDDIVTEIGCEFRTSLVKEWT
jgi:hypothetical protein